MVFPPEKLAEANRKFASLKSELSASEQVETQMSGIRRRRKLAQAFSSKDKQQQHHHHHLQQQPGRKMHEIKLAFSEYYLGVILLQNYQTLNFTGFRKILKKHDKVRSERYKHPSLTWSLKRPC